MKKILFALMILGTFLSACNGGSDAATNCRGYDSITVKYGFEYNPGTDCIVKVHDTMSYWINGVVDDIKTVTRP